MNHSKVKVEDEVFNTTVPASSVSLPEVAMDALATFQEAMHPVCSLQNTDLPTQFVEPEVRHGEALAPPVDLVPTDPSCRIRRVRDEEDSNDDIFAPAYMEAR